MNYKKQLALAGSALAPFLMVYLGYKYTVFHGKCTSQSPDFIYDYLLFELWSINTLALYS